MIKIKTGFSQAGWPFPGGFTEYKDTTLEKKVQTAKDAVKARINIVHIFDQYLPKGGMTIAFRKTNEYRSGDMVEFAIANCSPNDTFSKKIGTRIATENFLAGMTTQLPILRGKDRNDINGSVKRNDINGSVKQFFLDVYYHLL